MTGGGRPDHDATPSSTAEVELRCVRMLADLWHAPDAAMAAGTFTTGSAEGSVLAGLALKGRWRNQQRAEGASSDRPNIVMGPDAGAAWGRISRFLNVELRCVPLRGDVLHLDPALLRQYVDENTIGVVALVGSMMDGSFEPVGELCEVLDVLEATKGVSVSVHVDAASGGLVAPFVRPDVVWDFGLPRVISILGSGHRLGLVDRGVEWVLWRDHRHLPEDLVLLTDQVTDQLGVERSAIAPSRTRAGVDVVGQFEQFLRVGTPAHREAQQACQDVARHVGEALRKRGDLDVISDGSELPVVCCRLSEETTGLDAHEVSRRLRERGWLVPAYDLPAEREDLAVLRLVVRPGFSHETAELFLADLESAIRWPGDLRDRPAAGPPDQPRRPGDGQSRPG